MKLKYQCVRHRRYPSKEFAEAEMVKAIHKYGINLERVYHCDWCLGWHITSKKSYDSKK